MLNVIYSFFIVMWELICCKIYMESFIESKSKVKNVLRWGGLLLVGIVICFEVLVLNEHFVYKEIAVIVTNTMLWTLYLRADIRRVFVLFILYLGMGLVLDYITLVSLCNVFPVINIILETNYYVSMLITLICKLLLFCFVLLIRKRFATQEMDLFTYQEWLSFSVFPIFTVFVMIALVVNWDIVESRKQAYIMLGISGGLLVMNLILFNFINAILQREIQIREYSTFKEKMKSETNIYRVISANYDKQRRRGHEFRNQISCIIELVNHNKYEELNAYLKEIDEEIRESTDMIDTNHSIVNAILNSKMREGKKKGIVFIVKINELKDICISDVDVVTILSNLLNNAMEACEQSKDKLIKVKFVKESEKIIISVENAMKKEPVVIDGNYITSKIKDKDMHGIGIENILRTVEKYNGSYVIDTADNKFRFTIVIPDK